MALRCDFFAAAVERVDDKVAAADPELDKRTVEDDERGCCADLLGFVELGGEQPECVGSHHGVRVE